MSENQVYRPLLARGKKNVRRGDRPRIIGIGVGRAVKGCRWVQVRCMGKARRIEVRMQPRLPYARRRRDAGPGMVGEICLFFFFWIWVLILIFFFCEGGLDEG